MADEKLVEQKKLELTEEEYTKLVSDTETVAPSISDLVDLPGMQPVYVDADLYIKSANEKPQDATELAAYGQGTVAYPPTPAKDIAAVEASIKEDLTIALERHTVIKA